MPSKQRHIISSIITHIKRVYLMKPFPNSLKFVSHIITYLNADIWNGK
jgi:hypothetical protein